MRLNENLWSSCMNINTMGKFTSIYSLFAD
jgi:hypothetical protein